LTVTRLEKNAMMQSETNKIFVETPQPVSTIDPQVKKEKFAGDKLHDALLHVQDALERSMIPFLVLGDTAKQIIDSELPVFDLDFIHIGVLRRHLTYSCLSILKDLLYDPQTTDDRIDYIHNGVPVRIDVIGNYYSFFENPDSRFYTLSEFKIPNPFSEYWKKKDDVI